MVWLRLFIFNEMREFLVLNGVLRRFQFWKNGGIATGFNKTRFSMGKRGPGADQIAFGPREIQALLVAIAMPAALPL
jgi:hypothetical protein